MSHSPDPELSTAQRDDLRAIAAMMVPASTIYDVPGADDPIIFADIVASLGPDLDAVRSALGELEALAGIGFAELEASRRQDVVEAFQASGGTPLATLSRVILQCYYRDERVLRSLGLDTGPPFPAGRTLEQGDWSLLAAVRGRAQMWRDPS